MVVSAGLIALAVLKGSGRRARAADRPARERVEIAVGLALLVFGAWLWRRRTRQPDKPAGDEEHQPGRIARWSQRATASQKSSFALGLVMFLPSPVYLLAVQQIANSGNSASSNVVAVLICAMAVLITRAARRPPKAPL